MFDGCISCNVSSTWKCVVRLHCKFDGEEGEFTKHFDTCPASSVLVCIIYVRIKTAKDNDREANMTPSDKDEDEQSISAVHYNPLKRQDVQDSLHNAIKHSD